MAHVLSYAFGKIQQTMMNESELTHSGRASQSKCKKDISIIGSLL